MQDFRKLQVWQKSHQLTLEGYRVTENFPQSERYGLVSQMRRSASSIPTNIAEGCGRGSQAELARFVQIAMGSAPCMDHQTAEHPHPRASASRPLPPIPPGRSARKLSGRQPIRLNEGSTFNGDCELTGGVRTR